ncbi:MAG TPA: hypothetical protein VF396_25755, partial [Bradyrhizobium sp.]
MLKRVLRIPAVLMMLIAPLSGSRRWESGLKLTLQVVDSNILTIATACCSTNLQPLECAAD